MTTSTLQLCSINRSPSLSHAQPLSEFYSLVRLLRLRLPVVGVDLVPPPITLLVAVRVHREVVVVQLRVVDVAVNVDFIEDLRVSLVHAESAHLTNKTKDEISQADAEPRQEICDTDRTE